MFLLTKMFFFIKINGLVNNRMILRAIDIKITKHKKKKHRNHTESGNLLLIDKQLVRSLVNIIA